MEIKNVKQVRIYNGKNFIDIYSVGNESLEAVAYKLNGALGIRIEDNNVFLFTGKREENPAHWNNSALKYPGMKDIDETTHSPDR